MTDATTRGFIGQLAQGDRQALLSEGVEQIFPARSALCAQGEIGTRVMLILRGTAKVGRTLSDGSHTVLGLCGPGDIVGEASAVAGEGSARLAAVIAVDSVTCRVLAASRFRQVLRARPEIYRTLVAVTNDRLRRTADNGVRQAAHPVACRTARMLKELAARYGRPDPQGLLIGLALSQHDLALLVGASRESVVRALSRLRTSGIITTSRRKIIIRDPDGLGRAGEHH
ncbi:Crp/Fnr family transcriptional regulator [Nonomuraea sp. NPDC050540]|uniref:Crp/Fnr family transcriptional regulator n=1 Tax=Nonomuraea sp. NPDC050540 TaxID=3364367 RepID=UPI0037A55524